MSARRGARARAAPAGDARVTGASVITDADLHRLFPPSTSAGTNAIALMTKVKVRARGRRVLTIYDRTLWEELGWSQAKYRKVKATVREAGIPITRRTASHGGLKASEWVLDRTWVKRLRGAQDGEGVVSDLTSPICTTENLNPTTTEERGGGGVERAPPCAAPGLPEAPGADTTESEEGLAAEAECQPGLEPPPLVDELAERAAQLLDPGGDERAALRLALLQLDHAGLDRWQLELARLWLVTQRPGGPYQSGEHRPGPHCRCGSCTDDGLSDIADELADERDAESNVALGDDVAGEQRAELGLARPSNSDDGLDPSDGGFQVSTGSAGGPTIAGGAP